MGLRAWGAAWAAALLCAAPAAAHPPYGLVADREGNLYFSDLRAVWRLAPDGTLSLFRPPVAERHVHELALAPDGAIEGDQNDYDPATGRFRTGIWRRTAAGAEQEVEPMAEAPPRGTGLTQDSAGNRYTLQWVSNDDRRTYLLRRSPAGRVEVLYDAGGAAAKARQVSVASVGGIAVGRDGALFFADGPVLRRRALDGSIVDLWRGGAKTMLRGLALAKDGQVYAADMGAGRVIAVGPRSGARLAYRAPPGWLPTAVRPARGALYVLEAENDPKHRSNRVRVVELRDGRARVAAMPGARTSRAPLRHEETGAGLAGAAALAVAAGAVLTVGIARRRR